MEKPAHSTEQLIEVIEPAEAKGMFDALTDPIERLHYVAQHCSFMAEKSPKLYDQMAGQIIPPEIDGSWMQNPEILGELTAILRRRATARVSLGKYEDAVRDAETSAQLAESLGDDLQVHLALLIKGTNIAYLGRAVEGIEILETVKAASSEIGNKELESQARLSLAQGYCMMGRNFDTLRECDELLKFMSPTADADFMRTVYEMLGITHDHLGKDDTARHYFELVLQMARKSGHQVTIGHSLLNLACFRIAQKELDDDILQLLHEAGSHLQLAQNTIGLHTVNMVYAELYVNRKEYEKAAPHARTAMEMTQEINLRIAKSDTMRINAIVDFHCSSQEGGLDLMRNAVALAREEQLLPALHRALDSLAGLCRLAKHFEEALEHLLEANDILNQMIGEKNKRLHADMEANVTVSASRWQTKLANSEAEKYQLQSEKVAAEMNHVRNELVAKALHISQKNELLLTIKQSINEAREAGGESAEHALRAVIRSIDNHLADDYTWQAFEEGFILLYPTFMETLGRLFPKLTVNEIRICALMRLNLASKDICRIVGIAQRSIESYRYRIRKKINLKRGTDLKTFLLNVEDETQLMTSPANN